MSFWTSEVGELLGTPDAAFAKSFSNIIPDNTMALAKIHSFENKEYNANSYLQIDWVIIDGDFTGKHVFHKLKVFDAKPETRHRMLNMLMLLYKMFNIKPKSNEPPTDQELAQFNGKEAGIRVQETEPNDKGKQYNWVSEVHDARGFQCKTGKSTVVTHSRAGLESAFSRNPINNETSLDLDDVPF